MRGALDGGIRLIAQARRAHGLMIDLVFGLFNPRLYSSLRESSSLLGGLRRKRNGRTPWRSFGTSTLRSWRIQPLCGLLNDEEFALVRIKSADTLSARAYQGIRWFESDIELIRKRYNSSEDLYIWLQLSKDESLYAIFRPRSLRFFLLGNIFESYLDRFVSLLEQSAILAESRALIAYGIMSALVMAFSVAGS